MIKRWISGLHFFIPLSFHPGAAVRGNFLSLFLTCVRQRNWTAIDPPTHTHFPQQNAVQPITHTKQHTDNIKNNDYQTEGQRTNIGSSENISVSYYTDKQTRGWMDGWIDR